LRSAIDEVFGEHAKMQRCRTHKLRNVLEALPKQMRAQTKSVMNAAYKLVRRGSAVALGRKCSFLDDRLVYMPGS
jgi:transposase-like protein